MATLAQISIEEYLNTSYRPDCEYIDGQIRERNVGKREHARIQTLLAAWFFNHERGWRCVCYTEWRTQVSPTQIRIPDIVLVDSGSHSEILQHAPVLAIEILSPDDTYGEMKKRVADYQKMGTQAIWIIDPETQTGEMFEGATWTTARRLTVAGTPIYIELDELFRCLEVE